MAKYTLEQWVEVATSESDLDPAEQAIVDDYASSIDKDELSLSTLMRDLAPFIAQETDLIKIAKALKLLAPVLSTITIQPGLAQGKLANILDFHVFVEYLSARLANKESLHNYRAGTRAVAAALLVLSKWRKFPPGDASIITEAVFRMSSGSTFKDQAPLARQTLFTLVSYLVSNLDKPLQRDVGKPGIVDGVVSMALAEKNPSCLAILFPMYAHLGQSWDLDAAECDKIWDSYIRYFPISVGNPARDSSVPSQQALRGMLLNCIVSNDHYGTKAFERLIGLLDTESDLSADTKKEVFSTMVSCIHSYSPSVIEQWTTKIWDALKFEVWNGDNEDFINGSLQVLGALALTFEDPLPELKSANPTQLSPEWLKVDDPKARYIVNATMECKTRITDSKRQYLQPSSRILKALAATSPYSFHLVSTTILPALLVLWQDTTVGSDKKMLIDAFNNILDARIAQLPENRVANSATEASRTDVGKALEGSFAKFQDGLIDLYLGSILGLEMLIKDPDSEKDPAVAVASVRGLALLFQIPNYLSSSDRTKIATEISEIVLNKNVDLEALPHVISALTEISAADPTCYRVTTLEIFISRFPESLSIDARTQERISLNSVLQFLLQIACSTPCRKESDLLQANGSLSSHQNFNSTVLRIFQVIDNLVKRNSDSDSYQVYIGDIISWIRIGIERFIDTISRSSSLDTSSSDPYTWIVKRLYKLVLEHKTSGTPYIGISSSPPIWVDDRIIDSIGRISMVALRSTVSKTQVTPQDSQDFVRTAQKDTVPSVFWTLFMEAEDSEAIAKSQYELQEGPVDKSLATALSTYLLGGFPLLADIDPKSDFQDLLHFDPTVVTSVMIKNATSTNSGASPLGRMGMLWMLQLLVNKYKASPAPLVNEIESLLSDLVLKNEIEVQYIYQTLAYLTAASLAAFQPRSTKLINLMLGGVAHPKHGRVAAASFKILLAPSHILDAKNFCSLHPLRFAKCFNIAFPSLQKSWIGGDSNIKANCLIALSGVLAFLNPSIYTEAEVARSLLPLVLDGINLINNSAKKTFIEVLNNLVTLSPALVDEYLKTIITRLTHTAPTKGDQARPLAFDVLINIVKNLPSESILREKSMLTNELHTALSDPSREVRERAQRCKTALLCLNEGSSA